MIDHDECFGRIMWDQFSTSDSREYGAITRLWTNLNGREILRQRMSKYFKLADLCQTIILRSMEDERMFSALSFLKSKLRNKLDKNMDTHLSLYV